MFFKKPDLTSGSRPILQQDETLLFVQNSVGLYEGNNKVAGYQNGHAYLTSHRACYIDDSNPRQNSVSIDLKEVERHEYQAGFLRSSAKVTLHPKPIKRGFGSLSRQSPVPQGLRQLQASSSSPVSRTSSPFRQSSVQTAPTPVSTGNWICPICSFNNPVPSNFDPTTATEAFPLPPCLTCGIPPPFSLVLKAAITATANRPAIPNPSSSRSEQQRKISDANNVVSVEEDSTMCPRCTFKNHPSLQVCEICGAALPSKVVTSSRDGLEATGRSESPGPEISNLRLEDSEEVQFVKFSFRAGGDKTFYDRLKSAMIQRKWLTANAPPIPRPLDTLRANDSTGSDAGSPPQSPRTKTGVGIAGLEQRGMQSRKKNEAVIGTAFEDLEALMASAKEIVALAEKFATESQGTSLSDASSADPFLSESAAALGMLATRNTVGDSSNNLFISELSRDLAEYVTNERRGLLRKQGGIMSLVDVWAEYNKSRDGMELVSPSDFHKAAEKWQALGLPVKLRRFRSGLLAVQRHDWNDDKTLAQLRDWLESLRRSPPPDPPSWDWESFGCGITAQDAAQRFGWSLGVANEELEMAEERGLLCREEGVEGLKFWSNYIVMEN